MRKGRLRVGNIVRIVDIDGMLPESLKKYEGKSGKLQLVGRINSSVAIMKFTCDVIVLVPTHFLSRSFEMEVE